ncbi:zinc finger CCHC domain-containing protein 8 isoform X2 [Brachyhypopomus gauderio]|uniref:zinc finger CCHC domain-containing protein 8 isoform X2 n=1 Tax=Brachyhypopomus gauderio TaxID=698409 RepID=UPI004041D3A5
MEVEFGDRELFEQLEEDTPVAKHIRFTDDEDAPDDLCELRERLEECDKTVGRLKAENEELRRKLNFLSRPTNINVVNSKIDGPLCQILFGNNIISKQYRQEIEDYIFGLIEKHQHESNKEGAALHTGPQSSSFVMEENHKTNDSSTGKHIKDAFSIVGSVLYFTSFCLDKLGQPLLNENPQLTEGWEVPKYPQVFGQVIALEGQEMQIKERRPKPCCFNCGAEDHQLRDCPKPKDMARISEKRKEFSQSSSQGNQRYHAEEVEPRFAKYKPGIVSQELLDALGVVANTLPPFIYRMRELGYPPGWLKEAEMEDSGLTLYDGKSGDGEEDLNDRNQNVSYDVSKLVDFPGFNVSAPSGVRDDYRAFGSIPMQAQHWKQTFATQLTNTCPTPVSKINKRCHESEATPQQTKKRRSNSDVYGNSDMDTDSDQDLRRARSDEFCFQPPLPPGSPLMGTPPPLPLGTPPVTPTPPPLPKGTPPPTPPTNASPVPQSKGGAAGEESEDGLTLEELEEQQRLLWAALESADNTNSDSEMGASGTPGPGSPPSSPSPRPDAEMQEGEEEVKMEQISSHTPEVPSTPSSPAEEQVTDVYEDESSDDTVKNALNEDLSNVGADSCDELIVLDEITQENDYDAETNGLSEATEGTSTQVLDRDDQMPEKGEEPTVSKVTSVPHRSKFAEGIIPFEDTPEFTEVAEATGVYLRIRDLLKGSPRNQAKNKK